MSPMPLFSSASRSVRRSSAPRTKGSITPVTPYCLACSRFCRSSAVSVGVCSTTPGAARLFRLRSTPPRRTVQSIWSGCTCSTSASIFPSSRSSLCPSRTAAISAAGQGTPSRPRRSSAPSDSSSGSARSPMRSSGPCRSISSLGMPASRISARYSFWFSSVPWERFTRMPVIPASRIRRRHAADAHAGPIVP